jgi:hypothetical protein
LIAIIALLLIQISKTDIQVSQISSLLPIAWSNNYFIFLGILLLIPNYFLESLKWKLLTEAIHKRNLRQAFKDVIAGLIGGLFTPLMLGDFLGRSFRFPIRKQKTVVMMNVFGSICQTYAALFFGFLSLFCWKHSEVRTFPEILTFLLWALLMSCILGIIILFADQITLKTTSKWKIFVYLNKYLIYFPYISFFVRFQVLFLTFCRTLIYIIQYAIIYKAFGIELAFLSLFIGVNLTLLVKTVGGGLNVIGDLSLRQIVGLYFFTPLGVDPAAILFSNLFVWLINIFFPVFFGTLFFKMEKNA